MSASPWQYFTMEELTCKCGCARMEMVSTFMVKIVSLRRHLGFMFPVSSGFRCQNHNARVSASKSIDGPHTTGRAIDILCSHERAVALHDAAVKSGLFTGIGLHQRGPVEKRFTHLDDLPGATNRPRPHIWTY